MGSREKRADYVFIKT